MRYRLLAMIVALVALLVATPLRAETRPAGSASVEDEAPDSPRASVKSFLYLCQRGRYEEAARYLEVAHGQEKRAPELARKLFVVLGERVWIDTDKLSPKPHGSGTQNQEDVGRTTDDNGHSVPIRLVRHEARAPDDEPRWVFAQTTVQAIDGLYANVNGRWITDRLPSWLLGQGPKGIYWWQWIALPVLGAICVALGRLLAWLTTWIASRLVTRWPWGAPIVARMKRPLTMAWAVGLFTLLVPYLALTLRAEDVIERLLKALGWLAFFWALVRAVTVAGDEIVRAEWAASKPSVRSLTSVGTKLGKLLVVALALMVALSELGYPVTSVVAGLGIGGVAIALAAQKTVADLFGSVAILADQPFRVGDTIRVDGVEGTVESIGLRSTRMRTVERTLIIIPNGKLADMRIESLGDRDRIRFSTKLQISREAKREQLAAIAEAIRARFGEHERIKKEEVHVRLSALGEQSYDVEVAAPVETLDADEFARVREELLLVCMEAVEKAGAKLAVPTRILVSAKPEAAT